MEEEELPTSHVLFLLLLFLSLLFSTTQASSTTDPLLAAAAQTLTDSGFLSMALTLRLGAPSLRLPSAAATIFVPPNTAFIRSGPLPLSLLQCHILPNRVPLQNLSSLPPNTPLPTLLPNSSLTLTPTPHPQLSLNDVVVSNTPIFDDGSLLMLAIDDFFNSSSLQTLPESLSSDGEPFAAVSDVLKSNGCSVMASFLEAQLLTEFADGTRLTIFTPLDDAIADGVRNISDYSAIFRKHVVPRLITWRDLIRLPDEALLPTFSDGFSIAVTAHLPVRLLNGVAVAVPDMYRGDLVVVHGIRGLLDNSTV